MWFIPGIRAEQMSSEIESVGFRVEQWCQEGTVSVFCQSYSDPHSARHTAVSRDMSEVTGDWDLAGRSASYFRRTGRQERG